MTKLKLIAREPTEEMRKAMGETYITVPSGTVFTSEKQLHKFRLAWDAAPHIESDAEKLALAFVIEAEEAGKAASNKIFEGQMLNSTDAGVLADMLAESCGIIQALLEERK